MAVLGAHRADEPKAASVMPSPLEGLNRTMLDHSYWIFRWIIQQMQSRLVIMYAHAHICICTYIHIYKQTINNGHQVIKYRLHNARDQRHFIQGCIICKFPPKQRDDRPTLSHIDSSWIEAEMSWTKLLGFC